MRSTHPTVCDVSTAGVGGGTAFAIVAGSRSAFPETASVMLAAPTCRLVTLGCKVNQYETQLVKETLLRNGFREAADAEPADLCVVNTCTVTETGDAKSRQLIRKLARRNPGTRTIVMGCYATRDPQAVAALPAVAEVVTDKRELPDLFDRMGLSERLTGISRFDGRQRAYVKVQDGCILKCTYCIIPSVRPGLRSRPPEHIEDEVRRLIDSGHKEIVLAGIHVGHYGVETTRGKSGRRPFRLWHLFERLDRIPGDWRMRLSSVEAVEINDEFIAAAANCGHLCPQFHPSLQSGSETVLRRMRRRYTIGKFLDKLDRLRSRLDDPAFTTDVIVGFPGETDAEFEETLAACRAAGFLKVHVFPFSARRGTPAASYPDQVPPEVRKVRCDRLAEVERDLARDFHAQHVGRALEVLVEQPVAEEPGWHEGTDRRYMTVRVRAEKREVGTFVTAVGTEATRDGLRAERAEAAEP